MKSLILVILLLSAPIANAQESFRITLLRAAPGLLSDLIEKSKSDIVPLAIFTGSNVFQFVRTSFQSASNFPRAGKSIHKFAY